MVKNKDLKTGLNLADMIVEKKKKKGKGNRWIYTIK